MPSLPWSYRVERRVLLTTSQTPCWGSFLDLSPALLRLDLSQAHEVSDIGIAAVSRLSVLASLELDGVWSITHHGVKALSNLSSLADLSLDATHLAGREDEFEVSNVWF